MDPHPRPLRATVRALLAPLGGVAALAALQLLAAPASAAAAPNPAANIPITSLPAACTSAPTGVSCTDAVVVALDRARTQLGLGAYVLPADFDSLSGAEQLLILANLDRIAYGLPPISGLSPTLAGAAQVAMADDLDPDPSALLSGLSTYAWTSNWAGQWPNAADAYYEWMYDDGYDGSETSNIDCNSAAASGCWVHRRNVLALPEAGTLAMGACVGTDAQGQSSYTMTLVWTTSSNWTSYDYTWAQAQAAGAGSAAATAASASSNTAKSRAGAPRPKVAARRSRSKGHKRKSSLRALRHGQRRV